MVVNIYISNKCILIKIFSLKEDNKVISMDLGIVKDVIEPKRWFNIKSALSSDPSNQDPSNSQHACIPSIVFGGGQRQELLLGGLVAASLAPGSMKDPVSKE